METSNRSESKGKSIDGSNIALVGDLKFGRAVHSLCKALNLFENSQIDKYLTRCPDSETNKKMVSLLEQTKADGDSIGGSVVCSIHNCPAGIGEPVFDKLHADLAKSMLSIPASRAFELGHGFNSCQMLGSIHNDEFDKMGERIITKTNNSAGIQGGISNGMPIWFKVAFKPASSIRKSQNSIDILGHKKQISVRGRHDPCVVIRAVPIVEAMASLVTLDHILRNIKYQTHT